MLSFDLELLLLCLPMLLVGLAPALFALTSTARTRCTLSPPAPTFRVAMRERSGWPV